MGDVPEHLSADSHTETLGTAFDELRAFQGEFTLIHVRYELAWSQAPAAETAAFHPPSKWDTSTPDVHVNRARNMGFREHPLPPRDLPGERRMLTGR
ncbi:hypothetical protein ACFYMW_34740 [Streptomyces sp. NPDC006692]|uniref:hypothetical protein n=1 Tax=Streptomyces sp. NPDC006692 TaxID=3364758 RepID=UPI0036AF70DA